MKINSNWSKLVQHKIEQEKQKLILQAVELIVKYKNLLYMLYKVGVAVGGQMTDCEEKSCSDNDDDEELCVFILFTVADMLTHTASRSDVIG